MLRAAFDAIPGTGALPFTGSRGDDVPDLTLELPGVEIDPEKLADYTKVCGFTLRDTLPATYPHSLAFPLHMALIMDGRFPFPAMGLVHIENKITQRRAIGVGEVLDLKVSAGKLSPHPKGRQFTIFTEASVAEEVVWSGETVTLRRGRGGEEASPEGEAAARFPDATALDAAAQWTVGGDQGRRYAAVAGDRNPIHLYDFTAKPFGFSRAIVHGMWTKARALAQLEGSLPDALEVTVRFKRPILLPARVTFGSEARARGEIAFGVRDTRKDEPHLEGIVRPA